MRMSNDKDSQYLLRNRPPSEKLVDIGFKSLAVILASMVAVVLFLILLYTASWATSPPQTTAPPAPDSAPDYDYS